MSEPAFHHWMCVGQIALAVVTFVALLCIDAPYGRHERRGFGPTISTRWMWVVMEFPASAGFIALFLMGEHRAEVVPLVLLGLWQLHYIDRTFLYPLRIRASGKRSPLIVALLGATFQCLNSYINARFISELGSYDTSWLWDPRFLFGVGLFLGGRQLNRESDRILINLRREAKGYQIPRGGLFGLVSCPNYLGETIEWCGWAMMTWSLPGLAFALYTAANLVPRALAHHRWYQERFANYPTARRAIIPLVL